jgi:hypothetical protein
MLLPVSAMIATAKIKCAGGTSVFWVYTSLLVPETGINAGMNTGIKIPDQSSMTKSLVPA